MGLRRICQPIQGKHPWSWSRQPCRSGNQKNGYIENLAIDFRPELTPLAPQYWDGRKELKNREGVSRHCSSGGWIKVRSMISTAAETAPTPISWKPAIGLFRILKAARRAEKNEGHALSLVSNSFKHSVECLSHTVNLVMRPAILHTPLFLINDSSTHSFKAKFRVKPHFVEPIPSVHWASYFSTNTFISRRSREHLTVGILYSKEAHLSPIGRDHAGMEWLLYWSWCKVVRAKAQWRASSLSEASDPMRIGETQWKWSNSKEGTYPRDALCTGQWNAHSLFVDLKTEDLTY